MEGLADAVYKDFFGLKEKPFNLTPSPRFLYLSEGHKEALALLRYGIIERKGFILLTGEVGTGKTTIVQALINSLDGSVPYVSVSNPLMSSGDFFKYLAYSAFKEKVHFKSKADFLIEFEKLLKGYLQDQKPFLLIIDEAQDLSFELLEEIRLLSNLEYADEKLINIFLVGQPELNEKLASPDCRALLQRISHRYNIPPLDAEGTRRYLEARLKIAGARSEDVFSEGAVGAIHRFSEGYPRRINTLADNALLIGYSKGKRKITAAMVEESHEDAGMPASDRRSDSEGDLGAASSEKPTRLPGRRIWKWVAATVLLLLFLLTGLTSTGRTLLYQVAGYFSAERVDSIGAPKDRSMVRQKIPKGQGEAGAR